MAGPTLERSTAFHRTKYTGSLARDICVAHVTRYSSTPPGGALRIAIFATYSVAQIDRLVAEVGALL
jgi:hypothetical protein